SRNGVELPELLPRTHVEGANKPFRVVVRLDRSPFSEGGADNRDVAGNRRRRVHANFTGLEIDLLLVAVDDTNLQIDEPVFAERGNRRTSLRVEFREAVACRDIDEALATAPVGPVRQAASRQLARGHAGPLAFPQAMRPDQLARFRI